MHKNKFGMSLNDAFHRARGPGTQTEQCAVESLIRTSLGVFKVQLAGPMIGVLLESAGVK